MKFYYWLTTQRRELGTPITTSYRGFVTVEDTDFDLLNHAIQANTSLSSGPNGPVILAFGYQPANLLNHGG